MSHMRLSDGSSDQAKITVLVVEDNESERRLLSQVLRQRGYLVKSTALPTLAMRYVHERIDVVLTDLHLGQQSGIDLINDWKAHECGGGTAFIFITGERDILPAVEAMRQGAFDYLSKPIDPERLIAAVQKAAAAA